MGFQIPLVVLCHGPFLLSPPLQIGYALEDQVMNQTLALPVVVTKFCVPPEATVPQDAFFARWRALSGAPPLLLPLSLACQSPPFALTDIKYKARFKATSFSISIFVLQNENPGKVLHGSPIGLRWSFEWMGQEVSVEELGPQFRVS